MSHVHGNISCAVLHSSGALHNDMQQTAISLEHNPVHITTEKHSWILMETDERSARGCFVVCAGVRVLTTKEGTSKSVCIPSALPDTSIKTCDQRAGKGNTQMYQHTHTIQVMTVNESAALVGGF